MTLHLSPEAQKRRRHLYIYIHEARDRLAWAYCSVDSSRIRRCKSTLANHLELWSQHPEYGTLRWSWGYKLELLYTLGLDDFIDYEHLKEHRTPELAAMLLRRSKDNVWGAPSEIQEFIG